MAVLADQRRILKLLLWKNFVIRKRHWLVSLLFQIIIPLLIFGCTQIPRDETSRASRFNEINSIPSNNDQDMRDEYFPKLTINEVQYRFKPKHLYFAPQNYFTEDLMKRTASCLSFPNKGKFLFLLFKYNILIFIIFKNLLLFYI